MKNTFNPISMTVTTTINQNITQPIVQAIASSWFITLGAHVLVPFYPIPMTLQTFAIAFISLTMPLKVTLSSLALYVSYAAMGLPVLQGGNSGIAALCNPTAGYIAGFFFMSTIIGLGIQYCPNSGMIKRLSWVLLGTTFLFGLGVTHLASVLQWNWQLACKLGVLPFVFSEPLKCILATYLAICIQNKYPKN